MLKNLFDENDILSIKPEPVPPFASLNSKLNSKNKIAIENTSEFNEADDLSVIHVEA